MNEPVNYLAVLLATFASMVAGFLYYMSPVVAKPWMKLMGYTQESMKEEQKKMGMSYGLSFLFTLFTAYVMNHTMTFAMAYMGTPAVQTGLTTAFWMWLGFVAPVQATGVIFGKQPWKLFWINTGYQFISLLVIGLVIGFMG